jgi:hypothetical protein
MSDCPFDRILPRTPYLVIPKMALQAMPMEWRQRFAALLEEAENTGLETPSYHVLRTDSSYTHVRLYDEEDQTSREYEFTAVATDPWAEYRHATLEDVQALSPDFKLKE